ncbi:hypothetical protein [Nannocystis punicea]|uniref:Uncharacterized protein n=1 Tax=Nannocystis punicea TaxID=2995304 RepID=A0ABY7H290_9BACT|nr:hypothetical protein [Nannocystis poenicansa]WAS93288.1 hypothetical protein O0S08_44655 [Nannocystis poenicansa]
MAKKTSRAKTPGPHRRFANLIETCPELSAAVVLLEELAAALAAEESRRDLQSTLGLFSDWVGEVRWKHAPIDAALYERILAVLARLTALSSEPMLAPDAKRLYADLAAVRDA